jgi:hypothetical protein
MSLALRAERPLRDVLHAREVCNGSAAEFLNDEGQGARPVPPDPNEVKRVPTKGPSGCKLAAIFFSQ